MTGGLRPDDAARALRLLATLPGLLRRPLDRGMARAVLQDRFENREAGFLTLVRGAIFGVPASPYRRLLAGAGCEYGDLERLVRLEGLEGALGVLAARGVYLSVDEAKGRCPVVRGSDTFQVDPGRLANPATAAHIVVRSSGSGGSATVVPVDAAYIRDRAVNTALCLEARGGWRWRHGLWLVPGGAAIVFLLHYGALGIPPTAWFSQVDPRSSELDPRYAWSARLLRWVARASGTRLPRSVWAPREDPRAILQWIRRGLDAGEVPHLLTFPSSAAMLASAAVAAGIDLTGTRLSIGGEPVTPARLAAIRAAGADPLPHYGSMETGRIGDGCLAPAAPDDVHFFHDLHGLIQAGPPLEGRLRAGTLLVTSLRASAPVLLLNVSLGDQAELGRRRCGCPLERLGWTTHLHAIRSHEKLTAGGMNLLDADAIHALEDVLPARFGGSPADYQLLEEEDVSGRPRLVLVVSPVVGEIEEPAVAAAFLETIEAGAGAARITSLLWRERGVLRIERRRPAAGASGKILHYHTTTAPSPRPSP